MATASKVDDKLSLTGVADCSFVNCKFLYSPGSQDMTACHVFVGHAYAELGAPVLTLTFIDTRKWA